MKILLNTKNLRLGTIESKIQAQVNEDGETDLYLHGDVGDSWWNEGITAKKVIAALNGVETDTVKVHINTYGGDVFEGISIHNILRNSGKNIVTVVDGIAASAGSLIFLAGDKKLMPKNTQLMIHNPWTYAAGNASELEKVVDALRTTEQSIIATYMESFVGTEDEIKALLDAEKYMTAEQSIAFGFADELITSEGSEVTNASIMERLFNKYNGQMQPQTTSVTNKRVNPLENFINIFEEENNNV